MQISVDVHNYMETLVGQVLATEEYVSSYTSEQLADLACLALGQLKPIYIRFDIDFLSALPEDKLVLYKRNSEIAVKNRGRRFPFSLLTRRAFPFPLYRCDSK